MSLSCLHGGGLDRQRVPAATPLKFYEPRTTRRVRTRATSSFTALGSQPGGEGKPSPWTLRGTASGLQGTLRFLFAAFACFAVKIIKDTPFFVRGFAYFAVKIQRTLTLNSMNRERRELHERGPLLPSRLSVPTLEGRGNLSLDSTSNRFQSTTDTPFEFYEPRTTRTARTSRSRPYKLSRLELQRTLRFTFPRSPPGTVSGLQGTLHFSDVRSYNGHSFFVRVFRAFRG